MAAASKYKFTTADTNAIGALGYSFVGISQSAFALFIQKKYPGFNLAHLLQQVENLMVPHAGSTVTRLIQVNGDELRVTLQNDHDGDEDIALIFDRIFYKENGAIRISHKFLVFPIPARNKGLSKKVLKASLEQYKNMDAETVKVVAGLSKGAFVWARYGFVAVNKSEMQDILIKAQLELSDKQYKRVEAIFNNYYITRKGVDSFPIKRWAMLPYMEKVLMDPESQWEGRLDLKNKKQLRKFEDYVS